MQDEVADLYLEALQNERIRHDLMKEAPVKLSAEVALAKNSQWMWEKVKRKKVEERSREVKKAVPGNRTRETLVGLPGNEMERRWPT